MGMVSEFKEYIARSEEQTSELQSLMRITYRHTLSLPESPPTSELLHELSRRYVRRAGDLGFMGTPAGVGPLQPGDAFVASLDGVVTLQGSIAPPTVTE